MTSTAIISLISTLSASDHLPTHFLDPIRVNDEPWIGRVLSHSVTSRDDAFREGVRARDGKCVMSGVINMKAPSSWVPFQCAHVFPMSAENRWIEYGYRRWVTDMEDSVGLPSINSTQNGLLMKSDEHNELDSYLFSINPDVSAISEEVSNNKH